MSLSESQRKKLAEQYVQKYFPDASSSQVTQIRDFAALQFMGDYSTLANENDHPRTAARSGQTFEQFVIRHGWDITDKWPLNVTHEQLGRIIKLGSM